ncbi:S1/P1 nuclease [Uliginosibacterium aquaticum]|uniref:5'-nucleotidase C-terminal domain-containing protein n=1 Tax=Uliginosibacterium aquaticum TaxID=2731212 RepID=A0ABX2IQC0_9RHOO|nr:S1/P1 nuclease [Uliginosibacterium aquaticum]NSL56340.1 5'-nucleotidase C-terminal domain-containing protein [Uliginosibacterium aquaticum]
MNARLLRPLCLLIATLVSSAALAWNSAGHQAVGAIADRLLEGSYAGQMVRQTLGGMSLETAAVWADCVKGTSSKDGVNFTYTANPQRFTECIPFNTPEQQARIIAFVKANWTQCGTAQGNEWCHNQYHYTDVAPQRERYDRKFAGTSDHDVVHAIPAMLAVLKGQTPPAPFQIADAREALMLLSHYVGDLHQPLHVESIYLGADGKPVDPDEHGLDHASETAGGNLIFDGSKRFHAFWDDIPLNLAVQGEGFAGMLARARQVTTPGGDASGWAQAWATELVQTGKAVYAPLSYTPRPAQANSSSAAGWSASGMTDAYRKQADQLKQAQLALAGARLAKMLQAVWPEPSSMGPHKAGVSVRLIAFNDFHGNLEPGSLSLAWTDPLQPETRARIPVGGAAALAGMIKALRSEVPASLVLETGDLVGGSPLVSTLFRHENTIALMNDMGVDVGVLGNHEFDAGIKELKRLEKGGCAASAPDSMTSSCAEGAYAGMKFSLLGANVRDARTGKALFAPYTIRKVKGIPVAFIGAVTRETPSVVVRSSIAGLRFDDEANTLNRTARLLRKNGIKAIVAMVHEGGEIGSEEKPADWNDASCPQAKGAIFEIAKRTTQDIDVIFSAHTHQGYRCVIDGRPVMQAVNYGRGVSVVDLVLDPKTHDVDRQRTVSANLPVVGERTTLLQRLQLARVTAPAFSGALLNAEPDPAIAARVEAFVQQAAPRAQRPVARVTASFVRGETRSDSTAGRLIADAQLAAARPEDKGAAQIAFLNEGGIRADLLCKEANGCTVGFGQIFAMQPFGNNLVVMTLTGAQIKTALEMQWPAGASKPRFLQPSAGFSYVWHDDAPLGSRVSDIVLEGLPLEMTREYRVVVNNFLSEGGDGFLVFRDGRNRQAGGQDIDALLDYMKPSLAADGKAFAPDAQVRGKRMP